MRDVSIARPPRATPDVGSGVGVLDRVVAILDAIEAGNARSLADITQATGYTRSTTHRLLQAMEAHDLLDYSGPRGYHLGPRFLRLANRALRELPLRDLAHPVLTRLSETTGESAQLYVRSVDERVCIDAVESPSELRTIVAVGAALPLTKGSAGKLFLAWATPADRDRLSAELEPSIRGATRPADPHGPATRMDGKRGRARTRGGIGQRADRRDTRRPGGRDLGVRPGVATAAAEARSDTRRR